MASKTLLYALIAYSTFIFDCSQLLPFSVTGAFLFFRILVPPAQHEINPEEKIYETV